MLIFDSKKFIKSPFDNEMELERVVTKNYEYLFGPDSFYLPKTKIKTSDGVGTIPDGFAIDLGQRKWYIVEAELGHHDVWNHIAKQVSKQIVASLQLLTKRSLEDISVDLYSQDDTLKEKFSNLGISSVDVRKVIRDILETDPIIGIPIDYIPNVQTPVYLTTTSRFYLTTASRFKLTTLSRSKLTTLSRSKLTSSSRSKLTTC